MKSRDRLWPCVNISRATMIVAAWSGIPEGATGTLRYIGNHYGTVYWTDARYGIGRVPLVLLAPTDARGQGGAA